MLSILQIHDQPDNGFAVLLAMIMGELGTHVGCSADVGPGCLCQIVEFSYY